MNSSYSELRGDNKTKKKLSAITDLQPQLKRTNLKVCVYTYSVHTYIVCIYVCTYKYKYLKH